MNNDELKKKLCDIISTAYISVILQKCEIEDIADTLISAGIGDVKEAERKSFVFKNELAFTIHRAEVAERKGMTDEKVYSVDEVNHLISEMDKVIAKLKTENAALRERLEKSGELPVNIGDVKYLISSDKSCVLEEKVIAVQVTKYEYNVEVDEIDTKNQYGTIESFKIKQWNGDMFFKTREEAEARLAELKGEEK